jgi:hypothetical protein
LHLPLTTVPLESVAGRPPPDVARFLRAAFRRVEHIQKCHRFPAFVSSDFALAYEALRYLEASTLVPGDLFCEWGSGLGVVCCLAAMTGFRAFGVEANGWLVRAARRLAFDFDLPAEFARGNFIPRGVGDRLLAGREFAWLSTDGRCGHKALGITPDEFDLIYAYPWPDEEWLIEDLFEARARPGALLLTYHGEQGLWLRRKRNGSAFLD